MKTQIIILSFLDFGCKGKKLTSNDDNKKRISSDFYESLTI